MVNNINIKKDTFNNSTDKSIHVVNINKEYCHRNSCSYIKKKLHLKWLAILFVLIHIWIVM